SYGPIVFIHLQVTFPCKCYQHRFCPFLWHFPSFHTVLHTSCICLIRSSPPAFIISAVISSCPGLLFIGMRFTASSTSSRSIYSASSSLGGGLIFSISSVLCCFIMSLFLYYSLFFYIF